MVEAAAYDKLAFALFIRFCFFRNVSLLFCSMLTQHGQFELVDVESETT